MGGRKGGSHRAHRESDDAGARLIHLQSTQRKDNANSVISGLVSAVSVLKPSLLAFAPTEFIHNPGGGAAGPSP
jgi:hypothetical protein